jgi:Fibronectin type III domain
MATKAYLRLLQFSLIILLNMAVSYNYDILAAYTAGTTVTLAWDPDPFPNLAGYRLYYGTSSGDYSQKIEVGSSTTVSVPNLTEGETYFFAVTAYNMAAVESRPSNQISYTVPFSSPAAAGGKASSRPVPAASATPPMPTAKPAPVAYRSWSILRPRKTRLLKSRQRVDATRLKRSGFIEAAAYADWCRERY